MSQAVAAHRREGQSAQRAPAARPQDQHGGRFVTWAYRFVILEVSSKLGRHFWRNPPVTLDEGRWADLPDRFGLDPEQYVAAGLLAEVQRVVDDELTVHQRRVFTAIAVDGIPLDALAPRLGLQRNAIYKDPAGAYPGIAAHLAACGPCRENFAGLLAAVTGGQSS